VTPSHDEGLAPGPDDGDEARPGWLAGLALLGLFGAFTVAVRPVLTPFVLYAVFVYVAWPWLGHPLVARLAMAATALVGLWILEETGLLLAPFILALILAYVLDPLVDLLERWMPRAAGIAVLALPLAGVGVFVALVVLPAVGRQLSELIADVPSYLAVLEGWVTDLRAWVIGLGIQGLDEETIPAIREIDAKAVVSYLRERQSDVAEQGLSAVLGIGRGLGAVLTVAGYLVLLPILTYYLLRDWDRLRERLADLIPRTRKDGILSFVGEYDRLLNRYLRGQLLLALCVGLMIGVGFWIVGFPYALLLGLLAGILNVVPYLGLLVSVAAAVLISLFSGAVVASLLKVAVVYGVEQVVENVISPKIVGESVGLHPVWVILALALFSFFFGFVGLLVAVPAAVLAKLAAEAAVSRYRASAWYLKGTPPGKDT
jgi:predicted PurR-regulated permease PerM